ncbi:uncharacterized protein LOC113462426 isoform X1 [Phoenix dactylifera]|uniref:Uncharacterized protein LOC113462426 isoform X1 n=1 Tax=Phoenix dactylifera TaxID=42345 RepID=A0A8B9AB39_PHODC|nr:uncharacterized protein LOC113462426 isoform X1 [Phoenix dactylifera]
MSLPVSKQFRSPRLFEMARNEQWLQGLFISLHLMNCSGKGSSLFQVELCRILLIYSKHITADEELCQVLKPLSSPIAWMIRHGSRSTLSSVEG